MLVIIIIIILLLFLPIECRFIRGNSAFNLASLHKAMLKKLKSYQFYQRISILRLCQKLMTSLLF